MDRPKIYTITEITRHIKYLLEGSIPTIWVEGEISNFTHHASGHMYFSLKDENSQIRCVMWRWNNQGLFFTPQNGMKVLVQGDVTVYERGGQYQLDVFQLQPAGIGELQLAFERLKRRLAEEGLFDQGHKKPLPRFPTSIGVVTSPSGAAIRDIVNIVQRRFPAAQIILNPVRVQGEGAAKEVARAIEEFNQYSKVDVLIVGRGGGSLEDLWAFNEEVVAWAIFDSRIPIISAVGHEIDFTIADFVADVRAPTPSAAAELGVPDRNEVLSTLRHLEDRLVATVRSRLESYRDRISDLMASYAFRRPLDLIDQQLQRIDDLSRSLTSGFLHYWESRRDNLLSLTKRLKGLSPLEILKRGYALCHKLPEMEVVKDAGSLKFRDKLEVRFYRGRVNCRVEEVVE